MSRDFTALEGPHSSGPEFERCGAEEAAGCGKTENGLTVKTSALTLDSALASATAILHRVTLKRYFSCLATLGVSTGDTL